MLYWHNNLQFPSSQFKWTMLRKLISNFWKVTEKSVSPSSLYFMFMFNFSFSAAVSLDNANTSFLFVSHLTVICLTHEKEDISTTNIWKSICWSAVDQDQNQQLFLSSARSDKFWWKIIDSKQFLLNNNFAHILLQNPFNLVETLKV